MLANTTPVEVLQDFHFKPIPKSIGVLQLTVERVYSGFNKVTPKYQLKLSDTAKVLLKAEKVTNSATPSYKITLHRPGLNMTDQKGKDYLGYLKGNLKKSMFFLFDNGTQPQDIKKDMIGYVEPRKQLGTVLCVGRADKNSKVSRHYDYYIPETSEDPNEIGAWPDNMYKKKTVAQEYLAQK